jgi:hypothetical protein
MSIGSKKFTEFIFVCYLLAAVEDVTCCIFEWIIQQILQKNWKLFIDWQFLLQLFLEDGNKYVMRFYLSIQSKSCAIVVGYERGYEEALWERNHFVQYQYEMWNFSFNTWYIIDVFRSFTLLNETKIYQLFEMGDFVSGLWESVLMLWEI